MSCETVIVVRAACAADEPARAELVRLGLAALFFDTFMLFFFQELTMQCCVLCGAVLFIFCGASLAACALLVPAAALMVALAVYISHLAQADKNLQNIRKEENGFVVEAHGPLAAGAGPPITLRLVMQPFELHTSAHSQVVGTVSLSQYWGPRNSGWLHALAVHPQWQRRGVGHALVSASTSQAARAGLESLECVVSQLHQPARALLHSMGWEMRGSYQRPVVGSALTLLVARLGTELPTA